jgi:triphosphatase
MLFGGIVPRKASARLRDLLTQAEATLTSDVSAATAAWSAEAATAETAVDRVAGFPGWRTFLDDKAQAKFADSFKRFADTHFPAAPLNSKVRSRIRWETVIATSCHVWHEIDNVLLLAGYYDAAQANAGWKTGKACSTPLRHASVLKSNISVTKQSVSSLLAAQWTTLTGQGTPR